MSRFEVQKSAFTNHRLVETEDAPLGNGHVRLKVDAFSFTANNITYAAAGDTIGYWQFFQTGEEDWGVIPVWGFANVLESNMKDIPVGARYFGYFPPAATIDMEPTRVSESGFIDNIAHRRALPPGYNRYRRMDTDPAYDPATDNERMLLWPLHITSFCLWDALSHADWHGAEQILILSASSKTSIGLAFALHEDANAPKVIGLTSPSRTDFVDGLGYYDQTLGYNATDQIDTSVPTVIVDMSGNRKLLGELHSALGDQMRFTHQVGLTHWDETQGTDGLILDRSAFFFAPGHIQMRYQDWGAEKFEARSGAFMMKSASASRDWLNVKTVQDLSSLATHYADIAQGNFPADTGLIVKL